MLADSGPVMVLATIAAVGSFTHISKLAARYGQMGWQSWAVAVCIDLMCVMAAREIQRDKRTGRPRRGWVSWPSLVLAGGIVLTLAANLAEADPSAWGWIVAATPAGAFLIAMSMLERRAGHPCRKTVVEAELVADRPSHTAGSVSGPARPYPHPAVPEQCPAELAPVPPVLPVSPVSPVLGRPAVSAVLLEDARYLADEHTRLHGTPISADDLQRRLRVAPEVAADLLHHLNTTSDLT
ncbi:DUF2637 domain-containing protein [Streptosporangium sp. NPDC006007]|uniref:DUF2637 domain-containing protein n=1 Tax=Streptosporangium sp. NPDC006007 TaxID=3154575 RepID=UPI00339F3322